MPDWRALVTSAHQRFPHSGHGHDSVDPSSASGHSLGSLHVCSPICPAYDRCSHAPIAAPWPPGVSRQRQHNRQVEIQDELRADLIRYLLATSEERARVIGELIERNAGMAELLIDLEADDTLRARFEVELLGQRA